MGDTAADDTQVEMWKVKKLIKSLQAGKYKTFGELKHACILFISEEHVDISKIYHT